MSDHLFKPNEFDNDTFPSSGYARIDDIEFSRSGKTARVTFDMIDAKFIERYLREIDTARSNTTDCPPKFDSMPLFNVQVVISIQPHTYIPGWCPCKMCNAQTRQKYQYCIYRNGREVCKAERLLQEIFGNMGNNSNNRSSSTDGLNSWFTITKSQDTWGRSATAYKGLFSEPEKVKIHLKLSQRHIELSEIFTLPGTHKSTLDAADLKLFENIECNRLVVFDVGQGSASAALPNKKPLAGAENNPELYFDAGAGVYANQRTRPAHLSLPANNAKVVILSHWDTDHWAGATLDSTAPNTLLSKVWFAPDQVVGPRHVAFAKSIAEHGGHLILLTPPKNSVLRIPLANGRSIRLTKGVGKDRNNTGLVASIECSKTWAQSIILPGDCDYKFFIHLHPSPPIGLLVPHHGARLTSNRTDIPIPHPNATNPKLIYSFGPNNKHGRARTRHPTIETIKLHQSWDHGGWNTRPGFGAAGLNVYATSEHSPAIARGNVYIDWHP